MNNAGQKNLIFMIDNSGCAPFAWFQMAAVRSGLLACTPRKTAGSVDLPQSHFACVSPNSFLSSHGYTRLLAILSANFNHP
jgi:hypothetical protein